MLNRFIQQKIFLFFLVFAGHFLFGMLGGYLVEKGIYPTLLWPASGFAVGLILLLGYEFVLAIFASTVAIGLVYDQSVTTSLAIGLGCALEGVIAKSILEHFNIRQVSFSRVRDVFFFLIAAVSISPIAGSMIGVSALTASGLFQASEFGHHFASWWFSEALGVLIVAPLMLVAKSSKNLKKVSDSWREFVAVMIVAFVMCCYVFLEVEFWNNGSLNILRKVYIFFPLIIWTSWRLSAVAVIYVMSLVSVFALFGSIQGSEWGGMPDLFYQSVLAMQIFIGICGSSGLLLSSAISQFKCSEQKFRSMFELSGAAMTQLNISGKFTMVNDKMCELFGYSREEFLSLSYLDLTHENEIHHARKIFGGLVGGGVVDNHSERRYKHKSGKIFWATVDATMISPSDSEQYIIAIVKDITLQKQAERDLQVAKQLADESNNAKSAFLAAMSHEIRTPLGVILGFSDLLRLNPHEDKKQEYLKAIRRNGESLALLMDDVLDLSKIEAGRLDLFKEPINLFLLLDEIKRKFVMELREKDVQFVVKVDSNVPIMIFSDAKRMRQILHNIVGNAVKFTTKGAVTLEVNAVRSEANKPVSEVRFLVKDTGCGIASSQKERLFLPFSQTTKSNDKIYGGTGLGLVLSRRLAQLLDGGVELVSSEVGEGSEFLVTVGTGPTDEVSLSSMGQLLQLRKHGHDDLLQNALMGYKILLAEDTVDQAMLIQIFLGTHGAETEVASNGEIAVTKALSGNYDFVLMDMQMPVLDGYEATRILRSKGFSKPIFALTAQAMIEDREKCYKVGCNGHISKPVSQETLISSLIKNVVNFA